MLVFNELNVRGWSKMTTLALLMFWFSAVCGYAAVTGISPG